MMPKHDHTAILQTVREELPAEELICDLSDLFKVFGDTTRMRILYSLFESELCVCDIARLLGLVDALNLDGGGSSTLWTARKGVLNHPYDNHRFDHAGERAVPNCIVVRSKNR